MFKIICIISLLALSSSALSQEYAVVVHPSNQQPLTKEYVKAIFLGKRVEFPNKEIAIPVTIKSPAQQIFEKVILGKTKNQIKSYWSRAYFTLQLNKPLAVKNFAQSKQLVTNNDNAISFLPKAEVDDSVKILFLFSELK